MLKSIINLIPNKFKIEIFFVLFLSLISIGFEVVSLSLVLPLINYITGSEGVENKYTLYLIDILRGTNYLGTGNFLKNETLKLLASISILFFIRSFFHLYFVWRSSKLSYGVEFVLQKKIFANYLKSDYLFFLKNNPSYLLRNIISETNQFAMGVMSSLITLFIEIVMVIFLLVLAFLTNIYFTIVIACFFLLIILIFYKLTRKKLIQYGKIRHDAEGKKIKHIQEGFMSIIDVKLMKIASIFENFFFEQGKNTIRVNIRFAIIKNLPRIIFELMFVLSFFFVFYFLHFLEYSEKVILPLIITFAFIAIRLIPSVAKIAVAMQSFSFSKKSLDVLNSIFSDEDRVKHKADSKNQKKERFKNQLSFNNSIKLNNISYAYSDEYGNRNVIVEELTLDIRKKKKIGVFGDSGSGKSTLLKILLGLVKPDSGELLVDDQVVNENNIESWHQNIGYVSQNTPILDDTLIFNITLSSQAYDLEVLMSLLKKMNLKKFILGDDNINNLNIGDRGSRISGGEKQRIGICRALYRKPKILILDEPTSSLDEEIENKILEDIFKIENLTTILVSHNLKNFSFCDSLYKLENKNITKIK
jgi:ABC-type bacteriocin/lantibiotic exporter with double-glycine peptidase domain